MTRDYIRLMSWICLSVASPMVSAAVALPPMSLDGEANRVRIVSGAPSPDMTDEELSRLAADEGFSLDRQESPDSGLGWFHLQTWAGTDLHSGIDVGIGVDVLEFDLFGTLPEGFFTVPLQLSTKQVAVGLGVDVGTLIGRPEISLIGLRVGVNYGHHWDTSVERIGGYVSVTKLF